MLHIKPNAFESTRLMGASSVLSRGPVASSKSGQVDALREMCLPGRKGERAGEGGREKRRGRGKGQKGVAWRPASTFFSLLVQEKTAAANSEVLPRRSPDGTRSPLDECGAKTIIPRVTSHQLRSVEIREFNVMNGLNSAHGPIHLRLADSALSGPRCPPPPVTPRASGVLRTPAAHMQIAFRINSSLVRYCCCCCRRFGSLPSSDI